MRRYELKNKLHQKVLEELIPDFSRQLEDNFTNEWTGAREWPLSVVIRPFSFSPDAVEEIEAPYNPNEWNDFPKVTPPKEVLLQVEARMKNRDDFGEIPLYGCLRFEHGQWVFPDGTPFPKEARIAKFRAWDHKQTKE